VVSYEYSKSEGDPYYPVPAEENKALYKKYEALAAKEETEKNVFFTGRLATYRYLNTDEVIEMAFETFDKISEKCR
jgi:UDP-galactopyranose mutase